MNFKESSFYEYEIKKSKFIGLAFYINNIDEFNECYKWVSNKFKKADHVCFAYSFIQDNQVKVRYSDANEPKGTAGLPIYSLLSRYNLNNIVIFVVRFFGGIKLGSGLLLRTYSKCALETIKKINT